MRVLGQNNYRGGAKHPPPPACLGFDVSNIVCTACETVVNHPTLSQC